MSIKIDSIKHIKLLERRFKLEIEALDEIYLNNKLLKTITLEIINQCNFNCKHCYLNKKIIEMDYDKICKIIDDGRNLGLFEIKLSGGEITLHKRLVDIIKYSRQKYINVILLTNLYKLDNSLIECIKEYGVERVEITLFSLNEKVHDDFVGLKGALKKTLNNIDILKKIGVNILVKTWAIKSNLDELKFMQKYFKSKDYSFKIYTQIYSDINGVMKLPRSEFLTNQEYIKALKYSDISNNRGFPVDNRDNCFLCDEFSTSVYITSEYNIIPCAKYREVIDNLNIHSLSEIWKFSEKLKCIQDYRWIDCKECINCNVKKYCVRCGAMSTINGKDFLENTCETCKLAKIRYSMYENMEENNV